MLHGVAAQRGAKMLVGRLSSTDQYWPNSGHRMRSGCNAWSSDQAPFGSMMTRAVGKRSRSAMIAAVAVGKLALHLLQQALVRANRLAQQQWAGVLQGLADLVAAPHLANAGEVGTVRSDARST